MRDGQPAGPQGRGPGGRARDRHRRRPRDGRTASAKCELVEDLDGVVAGVLFVIELTFLGGRKRLDGYDVHSLLQY